MGGNMKSAIQADRLQAPSYSHITRSQQVDSNHIQPDYSHDHFPHKPCPHILPGQPQTAKRTTAFKSVNGGVLNHPGNDELAHIGSSIAGLSNTHQQHSHHEKTLHKTSCITSPATSEQAPQHPPTSARLCLFNLRAYICALSLTLSPSSTPANNHSKGKIHKRVPTHSSEDRQGQIPPQSHIRQRTIILEPHLCLVVCINCSRPWDLHEHPHHWRSTSQHATSRIFTPRPLIRPLSVSRRPALLHEQCSSQATCHHSGVEQQGLPQTLHRHTITFP